MLVKDDASCCVSVGDACCSGGSIAIRKLRVEAAFMKTLLQHR